LERLKNWLNENKIEYKTSYGGINKDIENIEVGELSIIKDSEKYEICHIPTANFVWLTFPETIELIIYNEKEETM